MRFILLTTALFLFQQLPAQLLIKNTNVIDVEQKKILAGYSVLIVDGKIAQVDKDKNFKQLPSLSLCRHHVGDRCGCLQ